MSNENKRDQRQPDECLAEAIQGQTIAIWRLLENLAHNNINSALERLENKINIIMATQSEVAAQLRAAAVQQQKTITEIQSVQTTVTSLQTEVARLNEIIAGIGTGGAVTQELVDSANEVTRLSQLADDQIPDLPVVIPPTDPTTV